MNAETREVLRAIALACNRYLRLKGAWDARVPQAPCHTIARVFRDVLVTALEPDILDEPKHPYYKGLAEGTPPAPLYDVDYGEGKA